ncbi:cytochrome P450 [Aspergillus chevalieri]|uniref:Cytochrome P450 n=1 Tax=Aspergillus chevalieri TaxID=182096 RepID=A0A7R7VP62_ASPCH|nr:uncharacterized protein ACHE_40696S [Aspergillus chevalieri]BCR88132.1 hypothetical protein ACHE_40696S [Aspergillus chevalieri]
MSTVILPLAAAALVLRLLYSLIQSIHHAHKARQLGCGPVPHYPSKDPLGIYNLFDTIEADKQKLVPVLTERRLETVCDRENRYVKTFRFRQMARETITTIDPENIKAVLATQFKDFELGVLRQRSLHPLLGTGIFTADGEAWTRSRGLLRPQFTRDQISQLDLEERHVQNAMKAITVDEESGWTRDTDIQTIFFRLTIDSATEFLFGESVDSQMAAVMNNVDDQFAYYFDKSQWFCAQRARFEKLHFLADNKESQRATQQVHAFVDRFVQSALDIVQREKNGGLDEEKNDENYVFLHALAATTQDPIELRSQLLNILLAGRDTTASLLSWCTLLLARHPSVFKKLRQTVVDTFGTYNRPLPITFSGLKSCQYLQHFLNETLRLYPVVPMNRRTAVRDTTIPRGGGPDGMQPVYVRKGESVGYNVHLLHRRKDIWGPDAEEFRPERWLEKKPGWDYIPFNGGPRICIGQQFALTEAGYVIVRLLQRFDEIEDVYPQRGVRYGLTLTSCPADPVTVRLHEAA